MNDTIHILETAALEQKMGRSCFIITVVTTDGDSPAKPGFKLLLTARGDLIGTVGGGALEHTAVERAKELLRTGRSSVEDYDLASLGMKCGGRVTLFYEYLSAGRLIVLFGGGHVAESLAPIIEVAGFTAVVYDPREEISLRHADRGRTVIRREYTDIGEALDYLDSGYCFIATHGHAHDTDVLRQVLRSGKPMIYVGMIGSKNKVRTAFETLADEGITVPEWVYTPAGLPVGGDTAGEIAVSIASEILAVTYGKEFPHMRDSLRR
jgi:xanthine dehydrogenase accessory factor